MGLRSVSKDVIGDPQKKKQENKFSFKFWGEAITSHRICPNHALPLPPPSLSKPRTAPPPPPLPHLQPLCLTTAWNVPLNVYI